MKYQLHLKNETEKFYYFSVIKYFIKHPLIYLN